MGVVPSSRGKRKLRNGFPHLLVPSKGSNRGIELNLGVNGTSRVDVKYPMQVAAAAATTTAAPIVPSSRSFANIKLHVVIPASTLQDYNPRTKVNDFYFYPGRPTR